MESTMANTTTMATGGPLRLLLTPKEAAKALAIGERTLWGLTAPRGPIRCVRIGRGVKYDPHDLAKWIESAKSASPPGDGKKTYENGK